MKTDKQRYTTIMTAELKLDIYGGESCEDHIPYWWLYAEGDMDSDRSHEPIVLKRELFPPGTRMIVEIPVCPACGMDRQLCGDVGECEFDWKQWNEDRYS